MRGEKEIISIADEEVREEKEVCRLKSDILDLNYCLKESEISGKTGKNIKSFFFLMYFFLSIFVFMIFEACAPVA